jgi:hypothetical protein
VVQGPGSGGTRRSASPMTIGSERFDTPHLRHTWQVGRSASHQRKDDEHEARGRRRTRRPERHRCLTTDGPEETQQRSTATPWCAGRPGVARCNGQRITRLPLLGAPLSRRADGTPHTGAMARSQSIRSSAGTGRSPAPLASFTISRRPPARARCSAHLAPEARQEIANRRTTPS